MITDIAYTNSCSTLQSAAKSKTADFHKRLKELYPCVDDVTKLPQSLARARISSIGLTNDNLGCYFLGRRFNDEEKIANVRSDNFIPPSCLIYYFEIKFLSKGRDGFVDVGLAAPNCNFEKALGCERYTYAYHLNDGNIYEGSSRGIPFGPKAQTGDIVGCGYNIVEGKVFLTQNGLSLGNAFEDIPSNTLFYPTIGLRALGEEVTVNFGQEKFFYNIEQDLRSLRKNMTITISNYPISNFADWQHTLHKLVQSWLLQNSYPKTAEAFTKTAKIECKENMQRVQQRNLIQQSVLSGRISEAIKLTNLICPNLLQNNPNLLFALKCRQFIELISGAENDFQPQFNYSSAEIKNNITAANNNTINNANGMNLKHEAYGSPPPPSVEQTTPNTTSDLDAISNNSTAANNGCNGMTGDNNCEKVEDLRSASSSYHELMDVDQPTPSFGITTGVSNNHRSSPNESGSGNSRQTNKNERQTKSNGSNHQNNTDSNIRSSSVPLVDAELDSNEQKFAKLIQFGQELCDYLHHLDKTYGKDEANERMLQDAIGLIAYINPKGDAIVGKKLDPSEREPISQMLNNSILNTENSDSPRPPLEDVVNHLRSLVRLNNSHGRWLVDELY